MTTARAFRGFRFPAEVILWAVRWYLQFPISYRDLEAMLADRGVAVDHTTMYRWVQRFAPELEKRMRRHLRPCRGSARCVDAHSTVVRTSNTPYQDLILHTDRPY
jgi:transposase, IS6 family